MRLSIKTQSKRHDAKRTDGETKKKKAAETKHAGETAIGEHHIGQGQKKEKTRRLNREDKLTTTI